MARPPNYITISILYPTRCRHLNPVNTGGQDDKINCVTWPNFGSVFLWGRAGIGMCTPFRHTSRRCRVLRSSELTHRVHHHWVNLIVCSVQSQRRSLRSVMQPLQALFLLQTITTCTHNVATLYTQQQKLTDVLCSSLICAESPYKYIL